MAKRVIILSLVILFYVVLVPRQAFAQSESVRVTGFGQSRFNITSSDGSLPLPFQETSVIYSRLIDDNNFGEQGVAPCPVEFSPLIQEIKTNSLVDSDGILKHEVFFAADRKQELTFEEIQELHRFLDAGGVLYLNANLFTDPWFAHGYEYNILFESLGLDDRFIDTRTGGGSHLSLSPEISTPLTSGPFGQVNQLKYGTYYIFNRSDISGVIKENTNTYFLTSELSIGNGYLVVASSPLYINSFISQADNTKYYLNMFAYACDKKLNNAIVLDVPSMKQGVYPYDNQDPLWESLIYDDADNLDLSCGTTMAQCGCALSSATMVMKYHGVEKTLGGDDINPGLINLFARGSIYNGTYLGFSYGNFRWEYASNFSAQANKIYVNQPKVDLPTREDYSLEKIEQYIDAGSPVILKVLGVFGQHWVVVKGYEPDTDRLIINDPAFSDKIDGYTYLDEKYTPFEIGSTIVYQPTNSDFRYLQFSTTSDNHILVTDSYGNKTGFDPESGNVVKDIYNSDYALDEYYGDPTVGVVEPSTEGIRFLTIKLPSDQEYNFKIFNDGELGNIQIHSSDKDGDLTGYNFELPTENNSYFVNYNKDHAGDNIEITTKVAIDVSTFANNGFINGYKSVPVSVSILGNSDFDVREIDQQTLTFGKTGDENSLIDCNKKLQDINEDGYDDLICRYYGGKTGLLVDDQYAVVKGKWKNINFFGSENVVVHKPWPLEAF